jgi:sporulation protein YlmC with PRC-barrel domain
MDMKPLKIVLRRIMVIKMRIDEQIKGKEVVDSSGMVVGKVKDVEINWANNEIEAIVLGKGGISESLGLSKEENIIPYHMINEIGDKVLLKETINEPEI